MTDDRARAEQFAGLFRAAYLTFHRRDGPRSQLPGASRAVLEHLALAGAMARLPAGQAEDLIAGLRALVDRATPHQETRIDP